MEHAKGGTQLAGALADSIHPDNEGSPETILIITDGAPDKKNRRQSEDELRKAAKWLLRDDVPDDQVRIVFLQFGDDQVATRWLSDLSQRLECPEGMLTVTSWIEAEKSGMPFDDWVSHVMVTKDRLGVEEGSIGLKLEEKADVVAKATEVSGLDKKKTDLDTPVDSAPKLTDADVQIVAETTNIVEAKRTSLEAKTASMKEISGTADPRTEDGLAETPSKLNQDDVRVIAEASKADKRVEQATKKVRELAAKQAAMEADFASEKAKRIESNEKWDPSVSSKRKKHEKAQLEAIAKERRAAEKKKATAEAAKAKADARAAAAKLKKEAGAV